jgi:hypothetical protein
MQFEPSWSLPIVVIVGFAAVILWYLLSQATIFDRIMAYPREHWGQLWNCPWCVSFYTTAALLVAAGVWDPITHLAAWGFAGFVGSHSG